MAAPTVRRIGLGETVEGENSAYLLPDRGVLVDPGPPTSAAWDRLTGGVERVAAVGDVDHVLCTHWHVDHVGLAPRIAEAADATIHMHRADAPLLGEYAAEREARLTRDRRRLREWGVPDDVVSVLVEDDTPSPLPDSVPVEPLADGDAVAGVECLHTPGHTAGHAAFAAHDEAAAGGLHLLVGDLLLPGTTPNVGGGDTRLTEALSSYLDSLGRIERRAEEAVGDVSVHPGHGATVAVPERVVAIRSHHEQRRANCRDAVAERGTATPWEVARSLFEEMAGVHAKMGAGEAASHLDALERDGEVAVVGEAPLLYEAA